MPAIPPIYLAALVLSVAPPEVHEAPGLVEPGVSQESTETRTIVGQVVGLGQVLAERGIEIDSEAVATQFVLRLEDGSIHPLLPNTASRALFTDARLRNRETQIVARVHDGLPYLEVVLVRVADSDGRMRIPEYFCDVCTISVRYDQICPCCQGSMELRMKPEP